MEKSYAYLSAAAISLFASATFSHAAIIVTAVGDGTGYDLFGAIGVAAENNEVNSYRSTGVTKTFDVHTGSGVDNVYGTDGLVMMGKGTVINSGGTSFAAAHTKVGADWATVTAGEHMANNVRSDSGQGPLDDPTAGISTTVSDWATVGFNTRTDTGGAGAWGELLEISLNEFSPKKFRLGIIAGTEGTSDGRWDPTGFRITDGGTTVYATVTNLEISAGSRPNMVFFDIDLNGETTGIIAIQNSQRTAGQGGSITGITFDAIPEPDALVLLGIGVAGLLIRRRRS
jgi:hypothetical protein